MRRGETEGQATCSKLSRVVATTAEKPPANTARRATVGGERRAPKAQSSRNAVLSEKSKPFVTVLRGAPNAEAAAVLRAAYAILRTKGWLPHYLSETDRFAAIKRGDKRARGYSLVEAIQTAGNAGLSSHYARQTLQRIVGPVPAWEQHPLRVWREVELLIFRGIELNGETPPRKGGWAVGGSR